MATKVINVGKSANTLNRTQSTMSITVYNWLIKNANIVKYAYCGVNNDTGIINDGIKIRPCDLALVGGDDIYDFAIDIDGHLITTKDNYSIDDNGFLILEL